MASFGFVPNLVQPLTPPALSPKAEGFWMIEPLDFRTTNGVARPDDGARALGAGRNPGRRPGTDALRGSAFPDSNRLHRRRAPKHLSW